MTALRLSITFLAFALLYVAAVAFFLSRPALAHNAPSGWTYDTTCCSGIDCAPIAKDRVKITDEGFVIEVGPGDHPLIEVPSIYLFPFNDERVRFSPDGTYHLCVSAYDQRGLCLYSPGFSG